MNTLELVLKSGRRFLAFFLDFSVGCPSIVCQRPPGVLWKFGAWWLIIWLLMMWVLSPLFFFFESLVLGSGLVFSHCGFLCDFSDVFKSLGWMWRVCRVWVGIEAERLLGIVWMWAWKVLISWCSGVAPSSAWVSSYNNFNSSLSRRSVGWLFDWWKDCSGPWWLYHCRSRRGLFWIHLNSSARLLGWHNSTSFPFWSQIFILRVPFPYFCSVTTFAC